MKSKSRSVLTDMYLSLEEKELALGRARYALSGMYPHPHWAEEIVKLEREIDDLKASISAAEMEIKKPDKT